jgi:predicted permease
LHQLLRNPLLVATLAGLAGNLMGLTLPEPLQAVLVRMGQASVALGLMAVGAGLNLHGASDSRLLLAIVTLIKVMLLPACALWVGQAMGLPREVLQTVVLFSALPTASSAYILTVQMGGNGPLVARAVTVSTLVSILSLPMWLSWVP